MKSLQNLGGPTPTSFIFNKQEIRWPRLVVTSKIFNSDINENIKPNLARDTNLLKFNKLINASTPLINNKDAEKTLQHLDTKNIADILNGRLVQDEHIFRQNFLIRSYESGPDCKMSIGTLIKLLQESSLNHLKSEGLRVEGLGSTPEMSKRDLVWVTYKMKIVVVDTYPSWGDVVQVDTWVCEWGIKKGVRRDWTVRNHITGKIMFQATSVYLMMNKKTRKLSKYIAEVREETKGVLIKCDPIIVDDGTKLRGLDFESADYAKTGLTPQWTDLDVNQHVSNVKYIDWVLAGVPESVVETHELNGMRLEFRKECGRDDSLQSLSAFVATEMSQQKLVVELDHTIRLQDGSEVLRGRTMWTPREC